MALIVSFDPDYTIRGTIKESSYINKESVVNDMIDSLNIPMGAVIISMLCFIHLLILHYALPDSALSWKFCYIYLRWRIYSNTAPELYLFLYWYVCASYNGVCVDMFVHIIMVSVFLCFCILYYLIVGCTSLW